VCVCVCHKGGRDLILCLLQVRTLVEMGFKEAQARQALAANNGDVNAALQSLLTP
jgi:uncharacterized UBP type Zn finger protein